MSHETNAIEVRFEDRLVGWLNGFDGAMRCKVIRLSMDLPTWSEEGACDAEMAIEERMFKVSEMNWSIDTHKAMSMSEELLNREVARYCPVYAESYKEAHRDSTRYRWCAVKLEDFEEYEWIFDHPWFDPVDTRPDLETIEATRSLPPYTGKHETEASDWFATPSPFLRGTDPYGSAKTFAHGLSRSSWDTSVLPLSSITRTDLGT